MLDEIKEKERKKTHTHTHKQIERERELNNNFKKCILQVNQFKNNLIYMNDII